MARGVCLMHIFQPCTAEAETVAVHLPLTLLQNVQHILTDDSSLTHDATCMVPIAFISQKPRPYDKDNFGQFHA